MPPICLPVFEWNLFTSHVRMLSDILIPTEEKDSKLTLLLELENVSMLKEGLRGLEPDKNTVFLSESVFGTRLDTSARISEDLNFRNRAVAVNENKHSPLELAGTVTLCLWWTVNWGIVEDISTVSLLSKESLMPETNKIPHKYLKHDQLFGYHVGSSFVLESCVWCFELGWTVVEENISAGVEATKKHWFRLFVFTAFTLLTGWMGLHNSFVPEIHIHDSE